MRADLIASLMFALCSPGVLRAQVAAPLGVEADRTKPPAEFAPVTTVAAKGVQIYRCEQKAGGTALAWVFVAPEATLYGGAEPGGDVVGTHSAGPTWRWTDGSSVVGKMVVKQNAPEAGAVAWLLLSATPVPGAAEEGRLKDVVWVRRWETHGGAESSSGCDAAHLGGEARMPYTAKYTFYKAAR